MLSRGESLRRAGEASGRVGRSSGLGLAVRKESLGLFTALPHIGLGLLLLSLRIGLPLKVVQVLFQANRVG